MKVLLVNGSPRNNGNISLALSEMEKVFKEEGIETEIISIGKKSMQRLFYSTHFDKTMKIGAAFVSARRSGATASFDVLNKYFTNCGMPVVSSQYWNNCYGWEEGEAIKDAEGLQTARTLARNASFLIKAINMAKESIGLPKKEEPRVWTNFFRD